MARFRRRKPTVAWLPHLQQDVDNGSVDALYDTVTVDAGLHVLRTALYALVPDYPAESIRSLGQVPSLADWEGSSYRLRRIVGKCFVGMANVQPTAPTVGPIAAEVGAGFIILRVEETTGAPLVATASEYSPIHNPNVADPWIWRRTWVLQNDFSGIGAGVQDAWQFPRTNCEYGSVQDGPHIDQKTARRVSDEERLFFVLSTRNLSGTADIGGSVKLILDYRVLASPLRAVGNRRNASR